jgi:hypothetical protein
MTPDPLTRWLWQKYIAAERYKLDWYDAILEMGYDVYSLPVEQEAEEWFAKVCPPPRGTIVAEMDVIDTIDGQQCPSRQRLYWCGAA